MKEHRLNRIEAQMRSDFEANMIGMSSLSDSNLTLRDSMVTIQDSIVAVQESIVAMKSSIVSMQHSVDNSTVAIERIEASTRSYWEHAQEYFAELRKGHDGIRAKCRDLDRRVTRLEQKAS